MKVLVCCWMGEAILLAELATEIMNNEEDEESERRAAISPGNLLPFILLELKSKEHPI